MKSLAEILQKINELEFHEDFDFIVGIANGGIIPAALLNQKLKTEIRFIWINYRDETNNIVREKPYLYVPINFDVSNKKILLVDDRNKTGATLEFAKMLFEKAAQVKTFVVNGSADYSLYNEACFQLPWKNNTR
ncbi:MAG: phosphoribosyltransferase [Candidatus Nanoarchaeia archaeon]